MPDILVRQYRNDSDNTYIIPGLGEVGPDQRISHVGAFPPGVNLDNYPGLVDVLDEEADSNGRDYEKNPETPYTPQVTESLTANSLPITPIEASDE